jgi:hypothetical protein
VVVVVAFVKVSPKGRTTVQSAAVRLTPVVRERVRLTVSWGKMAPVELLGAAFWNETVQKLSGTGVGDEVGAKAEVGGCVTITITESKHENKLCV